MATKKKTKAKKAHANKQKAAPWERPAPKKNVHKHLSSRKKAQAKARAKRAGRPYPNLIDNMQAAKK